MCPDWLRSFEKQRPQLGQYIEKFKIYKISNEKRKRKERKFVYFTQMYMSGKRVRSEPQISRELEFWVINKIFVNSFFRLFGIQRATVTVTVIQKSVQNKNIGTKPKYKNTFS